MTEAEITGPRSGSVPSTAAEATKSQGDRFRKILGRTIARLDKVLSHDQLAALADAFTVMCWEFPDIAVRVWLTIDRDPPSIRLQPESCGDSRLCVEMDSLVLYAAATGEMSLGAAFLNGRLRLRGLNPLYLAKFVMLINPLLSSFRLSMEDDHG